MQVIGDSPRAARYAGMRTRRKIVAVMACRARSPASAARARIGDFRHVLDPRGLQQAGYGYTGIVVAALARSTRSPSWSSRSCSAASRTPGYALQGADFPAGLVGMIQGLILFFALGGELLVRYRVALRAARRRASRRRGRRRSAA